MKPGTGPAPCIAFPAMGRQGGAHPRHPNGHIYLQKDGQGHLKMGPLPPSLPLKQPTLPQSKRWKTGAPVLHHPKGIAENP